MAKLERPQCEFRGAVPHPASPAYMLVWNLQSGTVAKWSCGCHRFSFGGRPYWVTKVEGFEDGKPPRSHEYAALLEYPLPEKYRLGGDEDEGLLEDEAPEEKPSSSNWSPISCPRWRGKRSSLDSRRSRRRRTMSSAR